MTIDLSTLIPVFLAFSVKHVLADYVLQFSWMARGKAQAAGWLKPLLAHAAIHAALTLAIALVFAPSLWWLGPLDLAIHAAIDRTKARLTCGWTPGEQRFWTAFGLDQMAHELTHLAYVVAIAARMAAG